MDSLFRRRPADSRAASRSASLSRRTAARRRRLVIESLEDRRMLATFSYADQLLTINLDAAASTLTTTAAGSGGYTFSLVGDTFSGSDTFGLVGSGKSTLSVTSALALSQITITNSADAAVRLGAGRYVDDVTVSLNSYSNPPVPSFKVTGNASFGGRDLSVTAPSIVVGANISDAKNIALTSSRSVGIQGTSSVSAEGDLSIRATSQVTQATGSVLSIGGIATVTTGAAAINLIGSGNDFRGTVSLANTGANNVSLTDKNALALGALNVGGTLTASASGSFVLGTGSVGGNLIVTAGTSTTNGAITQAAGGIAVAGTSSFTTGRNGILLSDTNNDFGGAVSLSYAGGSWDSAIIDKNALTLGASTIGGNLWIQSGGLSQTGVLSVGGTTTLLASTAASDIDLSTQANLLTGAVGILRPENVRDFKLRNTSATAVADVTGLNVAANLRNLTITYSNNTAGYSIPSLTMSGDATINVNGPLTQAAGGLRVAGTSSFTTGRNGIVLSDANNDFGDAVSLFYSGTAFPSAITDKNALILGSVTIGQDLTVRSNGALNLGSGSVGRDLVATSFNNNAGSTGAITQSGPLTVGGTSVITAGAAAITLANAANNFTGLVSLTNTGGNNISLTDKNDLALGALNVGGTLTASASGSFVLGTGSVGGNLSVTAGTSTTNGAITQVAGGIAVAGTSSFTTGRNGIVLSDAKNDFVGVVGLSYVGTSWPSAITDKNALTLGSVTIGQDLTVRSNGALNLGSGSVGRNLVATSFNNNAGSTGAITQSGPLTVGGTSAITAGAAAITLSHAANDFGGAVSLTNTGANNIAIRDTGALVLSGVSMSHAGGTLTVTTNGAVTQTGDILTGTGQVSIDAGAGAVTLTRANNDFRGTLSLANTGANSIGIRTTGLLSLSGVSMTPTVSGALTTTSVGVQQVGGTVVTGTGAVSINAGAGTIGLGNPGNDFRGTLSLNNTGAHDASITDANALVLGTSSVGRNLLLEGNAGGVTQNGVLTVGGTTTLRAATTGTDFNLSTQANTLVGRVVIDGGAYAANVRDFGLRNRRTDAGVIGNLDSAITTNLRDLTIQYDNAGFQVGDLTTAALRNVSLTAGEGLVVAGDITAHRNGTITLSGNSLRTSNWGVQVNVYVTMSTENGNINVTGWGGIGDRETGYNVGVISGGTIAAGGNGNVTITGTGGGVDIDSSGMSKAKYDDYKKSYQNQEGNSGVLNAGTITSGATGTVTVTGFGGVGYAGAHTGVSNAGTITSGGSGAVFVAGTGGSGDSGGNMGLVNGGSDLLGAPAGGIITSGGGNVTVIGNSGIGSSGRNMGVVNNNAQITSGGGTVTVTGTGGPGDAGDNYGVFNASSNITSGGGDVTVNGFGGEGDNQSSGNIGIFSFSSTITSGDAGNVTVTGTGGSGGSGTNIGIYNSVSIITSGGIGTVTVTGNGGSGGNIPENWTRTAIEAIEIVVIVVGVVATAGAGAALSALADVSLDGVLVGADVGAAAVASIPEAVAEPTMQELIDAGKIVDPKTGLWTIPLDAADASFEWISEDGLAEEDVVTEAQERATFMFGILEQLGLVDALAVYKTELSTVTADSFTPALASSTNAMTWNASAWTVSVAEYVEGRTTNSGQGVGEAATKTKGDGFNTGVYIDSSSLIGSGGGDVIIEGKGGAGPTGKGATQSGGRPGYNSGIVSDGIITSGSGGSLTISARAGTNGSGNEAAVFGSGSIVGSTGTLTMTSESGGFITRGLVLADSSTSFYAGSGAIELNNVGNNFSGPVSLTNKGAHNISIVDSNSLVLGDVSMSNDGGALTVTTHGEVTQTGAIVTGTGATTINSGDGAITLNNAGNNFRGAVSLANTGANTIAICDAGSLVLSSVSMTPTAAGGLAVTTNGALTQTGAIVTGTGATTINSGNGVITLNNTGNNFAGATSLINTGANAIGIRTVGPLSLSGVSMTPTASGALTTTSVGVQQVGGTVVTGTGAVTINAGAGNIGLGNAGNDFRGAVRLTNTGANNIAIRDTGALVLSGVSMSNAGGTLTVTTNGAVTQTGDILTGTGQVSIDAGAGAVTLTRANNNFRGSVSLANTGANNISLTDKNDLALGALNVGGTLTASASGSFVLGTGSVGGNLIVTAGTSTTNGAITQAAGGIAVAGTSSFTTGRNGIVLSDANNDFGGAVSLFYSGTAFPSAITDKNALTLGSVTIGQDLTVRSNGALNLGSGSVGRNLVATSLNNNTGATGAITQAGKLTVGGTAAITAGAAAITLTNAANNFTGAVSLTNSGSNNVAITDATALAFASLAIGQDLTALSNGALNLGTGTVGRNLVAKSFNNNTGATGAITQAGNLTVGGTAAITAGAAAITLTNAANNFTGAVSLTNSGANDAAIVDATALVLGQSSVGRNLAVTTGAGNVSGTGNLTQTGIVTVAGKTTLTAAAANTTINLATQPNHFNGGVVIAGNMSNVVSYQVVGA